MIKLDAIDRKLLELLQVNSKMNIKDLAEELHMTKTPIYERIKRYDREGIIEKYVAVLNREKLKGSLVVFCNVTLESQKLDEIAKFRKAVNEIPQVLECYLMIGPNDFLLKVAVPNLKSYHLFAAGKLAVLPYVGHIRSSIVLSEFKRSTVYPVRQ